MAVDLLPSSRLRRSVGSKPSVFGSVPGVPIYCANCGAKGPLAPDVDPAELEFNFHCWLCNDCAEKWGPLLGVGLMPDEVFFAKVKEAQLNEYQRELTSQELADALADPASSMHKLARER